MKSLRRIFREVSGSVDRVEFAVDIALFQLVDQQDGRVPVTGRSRVVTLTFRRLLGP